MPSPASGRIVKGPGAAALTGRCALAWQGLTVPVLKELTGFLICEEPLCPGRWFSSLLASPSSPRRQAPGLGSLQGWWGGGSSVPIGRCALSVAANYLGWIALGQKPLHPLPFLQLSKNRWWREQRAPIMWLLVGLFVTGDAYALPRARTQAELCLRVVALLLGQQFTRVTWGRGPL